MKLKLTRPLCSIDIESTGLEVASDRIVSLAIVQVNPDGTQVPASYLFNPGIVMTPEVIAIHGITNEMVANSPPFSAAADGIHRQLTQGDLLGFNLLNFDIPMLWEEFYRCGIEWDLTNTHIIDAGNIFKKMEERTLAAAVNYYAGRKHEGAHNSMEDALATIDVLRGQLTMGTWGEEMPGAFDTLSIKERYQGLSDMTVEQLAAFSKMDERVDLNGTIVLNKDGVPVFNTRRNRGVPVVSDTGYAEWMLRSDFPINTKLVISRILEARSAKFEPDEKENLF